MFLSLPEDVNYIINTINRAGYEAFAVGGCIRDMVLNKVPNDYDITTSASPDKIKELFRRTIDTGIEHGTVTVMIKSTGYEVTTYRIDGKYEDGRHPASVNFTTSLEEDLLRRDFTINAMAYNEKDGLKDPFGGMEDIKRKIIRCVGDPKERFSEDALRMLRAVRFSAQLGYEIEEDTLEAIKLLAGNLKLISEERIQAELIKTVTSDNPDRLTVAYKTGLTAVFLPEFDRMMETPQNHPHHMYNVGIHTIRSMENIKNDKVLRLAMLFHDMGKPETRSIDENGIDHFYGHPAHSEEMAVRVLRRLKFDNDTIKKVSMLAGLHDKEILQDEVSVREWMKRIGREEFAMLLMVKKADVLAQSEYKREEKLERLVGIWSLYDAIMERGDCVDLKDLAVKGADLIALGYEKGPGLGEELNRLLDVVIKDPGKNTKETLLIKAGEDIKR